ncbi:MAG: hypothetical protein MUD14_03810 [Hydrococcus sp. Prado102]|nr:hypothetical protein [Hydrococcus sp. Prado102]
MEVRSLVGANGYTSFRRATPTPVQEFRSRDAIYRDCIQWAEVETRYIASLQPPCLVFTGV